MIVAHACSIVCECLAIRARLLPYPYQRLPTHTFPNTGVASTDGSDEGDAIFFAVVSASVGSVSLSLLEHQPQRGESGEAEEDKREATTAEEPESISVPVHGLGTVSIRSVPVTLR